MHVKLLFVINFLLNIATENSINSSDKVAEWLRRWTANPLGSARMGSNPIFVVNLLLQFLTYTPF